MRLGEIDVRRWGGLKNRVEVVVEVFIAVL